MDSEVTVGLVEDDPDQAALFAAWMGEAGFRVQVYTCAAEFRRRLGAESIDLLLLDWVLPDIQGPELLDWLRHSAHASLPVVFLTARTSETDIVGGLAAGADDYVCKPARRAELVARVRALLRRTGVGSDDVIVREVPPYVLDTRSRRVSLGGVDVRLTDREFDLAAFLFRRNGRIVSRDTLLAQVWKLGLGVTTRTVDTHISRLRRKLGLDGRNGWQLTAVYQHGYRLEPSPDALPA